MMAGTIFVLLLYFGFKNLLQVPLPVGLWFRH
jgi:putative tricarboxylic transport membrane protein